MRNRDGVEMTVEIEPSGHELDRPGFRRAHVRETFTTGVA